MPPKKGKGKGAIGTNAPSAAAIVRSDAVTETVTQSASSQPSASSSPTLSAPVPTTADAITGASASTGTAVTTAPSPSTDQPNIIQSSVPANSILHSPSLSVVVPSVASPSVTPPSATLFTPLREPNANTLTPTPPLVAQPPITTQSIAVQPVSVPVVHQTVTSIGAPITSATTVPQPASVPAQKSSPLPIAQQPPVQAKPFTRQPVPQSAIRPSINPSQPQPFGPTRPMMNSSPLIPSTTQSQPIQPPQSSSQQFGSQPRPALGSSPSSAYQPIFGGPARPVATHVSSPAITSGAYIPIPSQPPSQQAFAAARAPPLVPSTTQSYQQPLLGHQSQRVTGQAVAPPTMHQQPQMQRIPSQNMNTPPSPSPSSTSQAIRPPVSQVPPSGQSRPVEGISPSAGSYQSPSVRPPLTSSPTGSGSYQQPSIVPHQSHQPQPGIQPRPIQAGSPATNSFKPQIQQPITQPRPVQVGSPAPGSIQPHLPSQQQVQARPVPTGSPASGSLHPQPPPVQPHSQQSHVGISPSGTPLASNHLPANMRRFEPALSSTPPMSVTGPIGSGVVSNRTPIGHVSPAIAPIRTGGSVTVESAPSSPHLGATRSHPSMPPQNLGGGLGRSNSNVATNPQNQVVGSGRSNPTNVMPPQPVSSASLVPPQSQSFTDAIEVEQRTLSTFFHASSDYHPLLARRNEYFQPDLPHELPPSIGSLSNGPNGSDNNLLPGGRPRADSLAPAVIRDVISVVVPCFTESARNLRNTLWDLYVMQTFMWKNRTYFEFHICLILDGWSKAPPSLKSYIHQLFESEEETSTEKFKQYQRELEKEERQESNTGNGANISASSLALMNSTSSAASEAAAAAAAMATNATAGRGAPYANAKQLDTDSSDDSSDDSDSDDSSDEESKQPSKPLASVASLDEDAFLAFPESLSFTGQEQLFSSSLNKNRPGESNGPAKTWEKFIANWSTDSDINPPTSPETLIIQKWVGTKPMTPRDINQQLATSSSGHKTVAAIPVFSETDLSTERGDTVAHDPEEHRRKREAKLKMTVIIKRDNRRKHNSHSWFLQAFAPVYTTRLHASSSSPSGVQLVFMTDAGTRFHQSCVFSLVQHALQSPTTVACSGRQRVMTHAQQNEGEPPVDKWSVSFLRAQLYRCAQGFEYEASISAFCGAFDFTGMLPVLPGPCGLFRLDLILREGTPMEIERAKAKEKVRIQVGKLRGISTSQSRALMELHGYVWNSLTLTKQMHRATWAQYCRRQLNTQQLVRTGVGAHAGAILEPFTPYEKAEAQYKFVELKTQLFALTDELVENQHLLQTVLVRLDEHSVCLNNLGAILAQEQSLWQRQQSLLVLVKQLHELESCYSDTLADGSSPGNSIVKHWDREMFIQLDQLRRLLNQQIYRLKEFLLRVEQTDGGLLAAITKELALDQHEQDYVADERAKKDLANARDPVEFYFAVVNQIPNEVDLMTANLMLAEDRILSYAVVLMAHTRLHTAFVPDALFFFEAETEAENSLQQLRRWTNGTVAGFLWLFFSGIKFRQSKWANSFLVMCQLVMYGVVACSPALWTIGLHYSLELWFSGSPEKYSDWLTLLYLGLYATFVLMHSDPTPGRKRLHVWLFHCITIVNMFVATLPIIALVPEFLHGCGSNNDGWVQVGGMSLQCWILASAVAGTLVLPFVLAILFDIYSLIPSLHKRPVSRRARNCPYGWSFRGLGWGSITFEMLTSCIWFYLYLPTKVSIYPSYSFSRTWELTWGNKPSDSLVSLVSSKTPRQLEQTKKSMLQLSQVISYSLLLANILIFLIVSEIGMKDGILVALTAFILLWALIQMSLSLVWILWRLTIAPVIKGIRLVLEWSDIVATRAPQQTGQDGYANIRGSGVAGGNFVPPPPHRPISHHSNLQPKNTTFPRTQSGVTPRTTSNPPQSKPIQRPSGGLASKDHQSGTNYQTLKSTE